MDDASSKTPEKDKKKLDTSLSSITKESKDKDSKGRARSRSIWGRGKKDKSAPS